MFDRESAKQVDTKIQDALFIMAVANSCLNPLVYGSYTRECRESVTNCCGRSQCCRSQPQRETFQQTHHLRSASHRSTSKTNNILFINKAPDAQNTYNNGFVYFPSEKVSKS